MTGNNTTDTPQFKPFQAHLIVGADRTVFGTPRAKEWCESHIVELRKAFGEKCKHEPYSIVKVTVAPLPDLAGDVEKWHQIVIDNCADEEKVRELALEFLPEIEVRGDSFAVPSMLEVFQSLTYALRDLRQKPIPISDGNIESALHVAQAFEDQIKVGVSLKYWARPSVESLMEHLLMLSRGYRDLRKKMVPVGKGVFSALSFSETIGDIKWCMERVVKGSGIEERLRRNIEWLEKLERACSERTEELTKAREALERLRVASVELLRCCPHEFEGVPRLNAAIDMREALAALSTSDGGKE